MSCGYNKYEWHKASSVITGEDGDSRELCIRVIRDVGLVDKYPHGA